jgi:hypothetical protein
MFETGGESSELGVMGGTDLFDASEHLGSVLSTLAVSLTDRALQNLRGE